MLVIQVQYEPGGHEVARADPSGAAAGQTLELTAADSSDTPTEMENNF